MTEYIRFKPAWLPVPGPWTEFMPVLFGYNGGDEFRNKPAIRRTSLPSFIPPGAHIEVEYRRVGSTELVNCRAHGILDVGPRAARFSVPKHRAYFVMQGRTWTAAECSSLMNDSYEARVRQIGYDVRADGSNHSDLALPTPRDTGATDGYLIVFPKKKLAKYGIGVLSQRTIAHVRKIGEPGQLAVLFDFIARKTAVSFENFAEEYFKPYNASTYGREWFWLHHLHVPTFTQAIKHEVDAQEWGCESTREKFTKYQVYLHNFWNK